MSEPRTQTNPRVLWFYGADAVGKSTIGWEAYSNLVGRQARVAYVDTDYLSFCHPAPAEPAGLVAENLRAVWSVYQAHGIDQLVVSGIVVTPEDRATLVASIPGARFVFCRLTARPETVRRRILARREAEAATQDTAISAETRAELEEYGQRSVGFAELLARFRAGGFRALDRRAHTGRTGG
ncbi:MAG: hypothetical protein QM650_07205 [Microlunatus sp.]